MKQFVVHRAWVVIFLAALLMVENNALALQESKLPSNSFKVMTWNIWHGGREDGKEVGPKRVAEIIKDSKSDIIAMQETYGSGKIISKQLGFQFQERGTNLSIHSRFPILEDISVFQEFKCIGSLIELPNKKKVAFYNIWLPYSKDIWLPGVREKMSVKQMQEACDVSKKDLVEILTQIKKKLSNKKYEDVSVILAGDFNSMSHLDYRSIAKKHFPRTVQWRTSLAITEQGFRDSYRENNPVVDRKVDSTWSPKFPEQEQDRIDFIYYKSSQFQSIKSKVIRTHAVKFPSDHAAVVTTFQGEKSPSAALPIDVSVLSYNIRRGFGTDNKTDLSRTMKVIQNQKVDVVGLQEVDLFVRRSGKTHQLNYLSKELNVHSAFGFFIPYQGGRYGMGVLSRHPFSKVQEFEIPKGNEPRIALACKVRLPNGSEILVVNIHLDWVRDDTFRFGQAKKLKEHLSKLKLPYILLGDFNDTPDSRTLKLLTKGGLPAEKPANQRFTYPATKPKSEIDFVVAFPANRWKLKEAKVVAEKLASDHRPVFAKFQLLPEKSETPKK